MNRLVSLLISVAVSNGEIISFQNFKSFMNKNERMVLDLKIKYSYSGEVNNSTGVLWYINDDHLVFETENERISSIGGTITTINKFAKQIIYDTKIESELNIFNIFKNLENGIQIVNSTFNNKLNKTDFIFNYWDLRGSFWTIPNTGEPKKISINLSQDESIIVEVNSLEFLSSFNIPKIDTLEYEIIDLRD